MELVAVWSSFKTPLEGHIQDLSLPPKRKGQTVIWNSQPPNELWCELSIEKSTVAESKRNNLSDRAIRQLIIAVHEEFCSDIRG